MEQKPDVMNKLKINFGFKNVSKLQKYLLKKSKMFKNIFKKFKNVKSLVENILNSHKNFFKLI